MANYFPPVDKIFDDLDQYRDFCRFEGHVFNEADLYDRRSRIYREFEAYKANGFKSVRRPFKKKNWKKK